MRVFSYERATSSLGDIRAKNRRLRLADLFARVPQVKVLCGPSCALIAAHHESADARPRTHKTPTRHVMEDHDVRHRPYLTTETE